MAHQCIKYRLTEQGTIPEFVRTQLDSFSGMYPVDTGTHQFPQELVLIGISEKDATGDFEVIPTKEDLLSYLTSVGADWQTPDRSEPRTEGLPVMIPFDHSAAADLVWSRLDALNAI
jgi:hypothetical protein